MKALIVYDSKTGNTEKMAVMIAEGIREVDGVECAVKRVEDATLRASESYLKRLFDKDQLVFRYCYENGEYANRAHPINPNGAFQDIAGICDSTGTIFGLMPHPERAYYCWQLPDWTKEKKMPNYSDGRLVFESIVEYLRKEILAFLDACARVMID